MAWGVSIGFVIGVAVSASALAGEAKANDARIVVSTRSVRLADLMDLSTVPANLRRAAAAIVVAEVPGTAREITVRQTRVNARARAALPAVAPFLPSSDHMLLIAYAGPDISLPTAQASARVAAESASTCARVTRALAPSELLTETDLEPAACGAGSGRAYRVTARDPVAVASRRMAAGEVIVAPPAFTLSMVRPGQSLILVSRVGPVAIQRSVRALQAGRPGESLFVQTADGAVFPALLPERAP